MGLTPDLAANALAIVLSVIASLIAVIIYDSAPTLAIWVTKRAARRLRRGGAEREEEWLADLQDFSGKFYPLWRAYGFARASFIEQPPLSSALPVCRELVLISGTAAYRLPLMWLAARRARKIAAKPTYSAPEMDWMLTYGRGQLDSGSRILSRMRSLTDAADRYNNGCWKQRNDAYKVIQSVEKTLAEGSASLKELHKAIDARKVFLRQDSM